MRVFAAEGRRSLARRKKLLANAYLDMHALKKDMGKASLASQA